MDSACLLVVLQVRAESSIYSNVLSLFSLSLLPIFPVHPVSFSFGRKDERCEEDILLADKTKIQPTQSSSEDFFESCFVQRKCDIKLHT